MAMQSDFSTLFFILASAVAFRRCFCSERYVVGGAVWSIPSYPKFYNDWSSSIIFFIGDSLLFDFELGFYNVIQVPRIDYKDCIANNPIKVLNTGPAIVLLTDPGVLYFICNISNYCDLGQKVSITVQKQYTNLSPTPSPSPSPSSMPSAPPSPRFQPPETAPVTFGYSNSSEAPILGLTIASPGPNHTSNDVFNLHHCQMWFFRVGFGHCACLDLHGFLAKVTSLAKSLAVGM
ncbi:Blue-copper-binding protein, putative [Theobroma cacao]|uniref:Blue-copper-binding protein, putative n=1 Tax=Theobroma cacao TaxID=3641 RepID=A0A061FRL1_THECC|nr:Blue-copper-binding protein, putative [Theobroma cacao]